MVLRPRLAVRMRQENQSTRPPATDSSVHFPLKDQHVTADNAAYQA
jgi:hypothetical protein